MDMDNYQQMMQLQQNVQYLEKYLQELEQQIMSLELINESIVDFTKVKESKEILVPIVNGIFFKAKLDDNSKFLVNIGAEGIVLEKTPEQTIGLIKSQLDSFRESHIELSNELNIFMDQLNKLND